MDEKQIKDLIKSLIALYGSPFVNEKSMAKIKGCSVSKLQNDRHLGVGLPYYKDGKSIKYCIPEAVSHMNRHRIATEEK